MSLIKYLGASVVLAASVAIGVAFTNNLKSRINNITALINIVEYISSEVSLYRTPVNEICNKLNKNSICGVDLIIHTGCGLYDACKRCGLLHEEMEDEIIFNFEKKLCSDSADDIVRTCEYTSRKLRALGDQLSAESADKYRLYRTISLVAGISAVILLI